MLKRFWSIAIVTSAVLLSSSTLVNAEPRSFDPGFLDKSNLDLRSNRGVVVPAHPGAPSSTSEPGDDDAPNKDNEMPELEQSGSDRIRFWGFRGLGTGIRLHLLKWFSALR